MLVSASYAIASLVEETHLKEDYVIPKVTDPRICPIVTQTLKRGNWKPYSQTAQGGYRNETIK
jgi:malic enzyme